MCPNNELKRCQLNCPVVALFWCWGIKEMNNNLDLPQNFTSFLKLELVARNKRNPRYSLRSFSKTLDLSSSFVSKLLTGKRQLTEGTFNKITTQLSLTPELTSHYRNVEFANRSVKNANKNVSGIFNNELTAEFIADEKETQAELKKYKALSLDQFNFIADWYHFAILELLTVDGFILNPNYIAAQLNITPLEAQHAVERLSRLGLIQVRRTSKGNKIFASENHSTIGREIATAATLKQQEAFLKMAADALTEIPIEQRSQTSMTMAIPKARLKEAQKMIHDFRRNMTSLLQRRGKRDAVYQLTVSFYPLTKTKAK
jgi:uncharacterized protein (TIGR02147 family)